MFFSLFITFRQLLWLWNRFYHRYCSFYNNCWNFTFFAFVQVIATINPGCPIDKCSNFTLVHVQLKGNNDMLHHIWTMKNVPMMFYARTDLNANLEIDWDALLEKKPNQSISFSTKPQYYAAVMITKVHQLFITNRVHICFIVLVLLQFFVYDDPLDVVQIPDNSSQVFAYNTLEMSWQLNRTNFSSNSSATVTFRLESYQGSELDSIEIIVIPRSWFENLVILICFFWNHS